MAVLDNAGGGIGSGNENVDFGGSGGDSSGSESTSSSSGYKIAKKLLPTWHDIYKDSTIASTTLIDLNKIFYMCDNTYDGYGSTLSKFKLASNSADRFAAANTTGKTIGENSDPYLVDKYCTLISEKDGSITRYPIYKGTEGLRSQNAAYFITESTWAMGSMYLSREYNTATTSWGIKCSSTKNTFSEFLIEKDAPYVSYLEFCGGGGAGGKAASAAYGCGGGGAMTVGVYIDWTVINQWGHKVQLTLGTGGNAAAETGSDARNGAASILEVINSTGRTIAKFYATGGNAAQDWGSGGGAATAYGDENDPEKVCIKYESPNNSDDTRTYLCAGESSAGVTVTCIVKGGGGGGSSTGGPGSQSGNAIIKVWSRLANDTVIHAMFNSWNISNYCNKGPGGNMFNYRNYTDINLPYKFRNGSCFDREEAWKLANGGGGCLLGYGGYGGRPVGYDPVGGNGEQGGGGGGAGYNSSVNGGNGGDGAARMYYTMTV